MCSSGELESLPHRLVVRTEGDKQYQVSARHGKCQITVVIAERLSKEKEVERAKIEESDTPAWNPGSSLCCRASCNELHLSEPLRARFRNEANDRRGSSDQLGLTLKRPWPVCPPHPI